MKKRQLIKTYLGFVFIILGIAWSLSTKYSCENICYKCLIKESYPCIFLFLFVGIIFVMVGTSLVVGRKTKTDKKKL